MTLEEFLDDIRKAKHIVENIIGAPVLGYRARCFSVTKGTPWLFDKLLQAGHQFDSSVFPGARRFGGLKTSNWNPSEIATASGRVVEFPITVVRAMGRPMCLFGGGYLRLFPYPLIKKMGMQVLQEGRPIIFYVHPREIDPSHPRLPMNPVARFKSYVNLSRARSKIEMILDDFTFTTFGEMMAAGKFRDSIDARIQGLTVFDSYAHDFDAIYDNKNGSFDSVINKLFRRSMEARYLKTLEGCSLVAGRSVLDIGCGPGHNFVALAKKGAGEVLGIDFADQRRSHSGNLA